MCLIYHVWDQPSDVSYVYVSQQFNQSYICRKQWWNLTVYYYISIYFCHSLTSMIFFPTHIKVPWCFFSYYSSATRDRNEHHHRQPHPNSMSVSCEYGWQIDWWQFAEFPANLHRQVAHIPLCEQSVSCNSESLLAFLQALDYLYTHPGIYYWPMQSPIYIYDGRLY